MNAKEFNIAVIQRAAVENALRHSQGNRTEAARLLGVSVRTVRNWIKKFNLVDQFPCAKD